MTKYIAGRIGQALIVLWAAYTVTFVVLYLLPGDPLAIMLSANNVEVDSLSASELAAARVHFGLDQPMWVHYFTLLGGALRGDFGTSISSGQPVTALVFSRLPGTLALSGTAILLALIGGVTIAYLAAWVQWRPAQVVLRRMPALGVSVPSFWVGLVLIQIFAFTLGWLPATGDKGPQSLILPAITMAIPTAAVLAQVLTRSFSDTLAEPHITTARAKGLSRGQVQLHHAFRNAALPTLTILGLIIGSTVTGAIVVETVFSRVGIGQLAQQSVMNQDIPVVQAIVVIAAAAFVVVNLVVDLLYPLLDPRVLHAQKVTAP